MLQEENGQCNLQADHVMATAAIIKRVHASENSTPILKISDEENNSDLVDVFSAGVVSCFLHGEFPGHSHRRKCLPHYVNALDNIYTCHCLRMLSICPHMIPLGTSKESDFVEILKERGDSLSITRTNKVNEEWVKALQAKLQLVPHVKNDLKLPGRMNTPPKT